MITKNYTADRTETPGDATSTIPAAMANYWINGVNSLISDLTPLKDAGGFYAPVDFNVFKTSSNLVPSSKPQTIPMIKSVGSLSISSSEITLPKGYLYSIIVDIDNQSGFIIYSIYDDSNNDKLQINGLSQVNIASDKGYGIIDLTSAASDLRVRAVVVDYSTASIRTGFGGIIITKYKLIPFTAAT